MKSMKSTVQRTDEEEVLKILSEQAPVGVCIVQDGKFCYFNSNFPIAIGYTADELVGKDPLELIVPEDRDMVRENEIKMLNGELLSPYQFRVIHKDGSIRWVMEAVRSVQYHGRRAVLGNYMEVTERKQIEEALKENEERYRELADSITDVFFAMDEHLRFTYWNKASEILTGIRAEDAIGKSLGEIFPDTPGLRNAEKLYRKVLRTQQSQTFGNDFNINGSHYIFEISSYPARSGISVFVKDITERKQAEEARREAEEETRTLLEEAPVGIIHTDLKGKITYVNQRFESESGYSRREVIGESVFQLDWFPAGTLKFLAERMVARLGGSPVKHWETQFKCKDGRWIWIELEGKILARSEVPVGFQVIATNVTERRQAVEALRQSEERYRTILEEMEDSYFEVDLAGNLTFVNNSVCRDLGYSREELIGMSYRSFTLEEDIESVFRVFNEVYRTGVPNKGFPWKIIHKDGTHGFAETSISLLRNDKGEAIGFRGVGRDIIERKKMEEELSKTQAKLSGAVQMARLGPWEYDAINDLFIFNDAFYKVLHTTAEEVGRYTMSSLEYARRFVHPEDAHLVGEEVRKALQANDPNFSSQLDHRIIYADGGVGYMSVHFFIIKDETGSTVRTYGVNQDITERKQAEEALRQSEEKYRTILEEMEDSYFEVDLGGHLTYVNRSTCRNLGYSTEELTGMSYKSFTLEEDIESVFRVFGEVYRTGMPNKGFFWKVSRKDGAHGFAESSVSLLKNREGEIIGFRGVGRDITERKQAEQALRQSEERYRTLFNTTVIGMLVLDAETMKIVMVNQAAAKMFRFASTEEAIGINPLDFIPPEDREKFVELAKRKLFEQESGQIYELRAVTNDGREIWINITGARIMHGGKLAGLISFADITEQKLQHEKLMITDRLATVGELAAGAAHELNNPLAGIIGLSELLMERNTPDYIRKDLAMIRDEARRAANVTSNLLTFARKHRPVKQPTQINDVIEDLLKLRAYAHKSNCIVVERHLASDLPEIPLDPFQIQQVFLNIVINAEYFMMQAHNRGTLTITTKRQNGSVGISFTDDGPGISEENLRRLFDPFFTTKETGKGTGLGLSICHGIVTEHGGQIYARSQPGKGATIFIELPIDRSNHVEVML